MRRAAAWLALAALLGGCVADREPVRVARPAAASVAQADDYLVRPGDTLSAIAARYGVAMRDVAAANGIAPPYLIRVGQRLDIPRPERRAATVRPAPQPTIPAPPSATRSAAPRLVWPADGPVDQRFGEGADPRGVAIAAHAGAAVRAASAGTVVFAGDEPQRYRRLVLVDHGGGWVSAYGGLGRLVVRQGEAVRAGARLGFVGVEGAGGDSHLHFELRRDNQPVDPLPLLPPRF